MWGSRKGLSTIVAEVLMLLIVIIMSSIVFVWVVPYFNSQATTDNATAAYAEKFQTVWGNFATFAPSIPETVTKCNNVAGPNICPLPNPKTTCSNAVISASTANNIYVPPFKYCKITANVGSVLADYGSNITIIGAQITGGFVANYSAIVTLTNMKVTGYSGWLNVGTLTVTGSQFNTSGNTSYCADGCDEAIYEGGQGDFTFTNNTVTGQIESEVSSHAVINNNNVSGRLEVESASYGQLQNNHAGMLDLDQNGVLVISGNTVYGNDPYYPGGNCASGTATAICYGTNRWCATGNNVVISGSHNEAVCIGNIEVDLVNTGSIPVKLVNAYMTGIPVSGAISWKLTSGGSVSSGLPITIPVGKSANVTMQWTPPTTTFQMPWAGLYFIFVSSHANYVDGYLYFGHNPALTIQSQSRIENRTCPPCY